MEIKPCPVCGSRIKISLFGSIDDLTTHFKCSNNTCGTDFEDYKNMISFKDYEDIDIRINSDISIEIPYITNQIIKSINIWNEHKKADEIYCNICGAEMGLYEEDDNTIYCSNTDCGFRKKNPNIHKST